uniref:MRP-like ABC transporter n=1 Tax=Oryza sativa subsp. japonica TaxID=39947 RepID=Q6K8A2_ORYSJ|nr:putative MRP-like ABC transporter [Oryza sativa Japonica Group]
MGRIGREDERRERNLTGVRVVVPGGGGGVEVVVPDGIVQETAVVDPGDGGVDVQVAAALMASIQAVATQIEVAVSEDEDGGGRAEARQRRGSVLYKDRIGTEPLDLARNLVPPGTGTERWTEFMDQPLLDRAASSSSKATSSRSAFTDAGFFSIITFSWMGPLLDLGRRKALDLDDVPTLDDNDSVQGILPNFEAKLVSVSGSGKYTDVTTINLVKALVLTTWKLILFTAVCALLRTVSSYVGPYLIEYFVDYLNRSPQSAKEGYILVLSFVVAQFIEGLSSRHLLFRSQQLGVRVRSALVAVIYQKGLSLSNQSRESSSSGEIINAVSLDAERVADFNWSIHELWLFPVQIILAMLILYSTLGLAAFAALAATVLTMLANLPIGRIQQNYQEKMMDAKDARMRAMSEMLRNMRILKLQGWEMVLSKIMELRKEEMHWLKKDVYTSVMLISVFFGAPAFVAMVTFGSCLLLGIPLETGKVLSALATFRQLQGPINSIPDTVSVIIQTKVSLDRICSFMHLEELSSDVVTKLLRGTTDVSIEVRNGQFSWNTPSEVPTLRNLNFRIRQGMRVAICGTVGSGKSSLLSCILGEIPRLSGDVQTCGRIAYVSQSPWIQSGTIEHNILFDTKLHRERYEKVLEACCLKKDMEILPLGDQTIIGERGINLSGGQKQRMQIARALYQDADIFLFDDPFSAVDAHTGLHLFKECLLGLLASKTVVYVTHHVEFLPSANAIMVMKDGQIIQVGNYAKILNSGEEFTKLKQKDDNQGAEEGIVQNGQLVQEEEREKGRVGISVYWKYITMVYGGALVPLILLAQIIFQVLQIGSNFWMACAAPISKDVNPPVNSLKMVLVYVVLAFVSSLFIFIRSHLLVMAGCKTAMMLFDKMHRCIFRASMYFFDSTPSGRILNRQYYIDGARELQRLTGVCRAPVMQHFAESVAGSNIIRCFGKEIQFINAVSHFMDNLSRPSLYNAASMEWLCFRLDILSSFIFAFALILLVTLPAALIDPKTAGLAVTYGLSLNMLQGWAIAVLCSLENRMISVERIFQYMAIPSEPPLTISKSRPNCRWPTNGEIELRNLHVRYATQLPFVLKGLTCTLPRGLRTGIVGRTGNGKSTLIQALFRIVDPCIGQVLIDGLDICTIGLHDLRTRLSIIPQDPVMFEGTLRNNIDPLEEYSDEQIWEALDSCHLGDEVRKSDLKLDSTVTENGSNWSAGQRQLVCLGRVVLKKRKILVLDEATSSVDPITDNLIQKTLKQQFSECTVITIAHRITSVLDSEKVILMDNGKIAEADSPAKLLEDNLSLFSKLVSEYTKGSEY